MRADKTKENALTVLFNGTCVLLLSLLYNNPDRSFYLREITRKIGMGAGTVQRELARLVSANLLFREESGRQVYYRVDQTSPVYNEMRGLVIKTFGLSNTIRDEFAPLSSNINFAFIYGSQADGTSSGKSDVDLMVIGDVGEMALHKAVTRAENKLGKTVNYSLFTLDEFKKKKKDKSGFVDRVAKGKKIMIIGEENEV